MLSESESVDYLCKACEAGAAARTVNTTSNDDPLGLPARSANHGLAEGRGSWKQITETREAPLIFSLLQDRNQA